MLKGLQIILEKNPVVPTVNAEDILANPQNVEGDYLKHVSTYIPMGDVSDYVRRLVRRTKAASTPKGLLVAPYGYGKTSTAAFLWRGCEEGGLVAVPPFYCSSLLDILKATYGWVKHRLERTEPHLVETLNRAYQKYTTATVDDMSRRYAQEHGIATLTATNLLNEMLRDGSLVLELTPSNLLFFLDAATDAVLQAGFQGLVVIPDEFQQYFSKGTNLRRTIQEFREVIWGLDTRSTPLGVILSLPSYAEATVQEQGKDILHRLKNDGFYYRLQDIYSEDFPSRLWERYVDAFELGKISDSVIDGSTLRAIGQIAAREDLGEGPRTVIDSFKRAVLYYQDREEAYTPIALINDFLESNINFQSQSNKVKAVTRQALASSIIDSPRKAEAIKLLAAFPRGCPVEVQRRFGLYDVVNALSKKAHGEMLTHLAEGYTLLGLSSTGGPTRSVDLIITRFWRSYEEDELHVEAASRTVRARLLPRFFETRRGTAQTGWSNLDFSSQAKGSYVSRTEGTFNPSYPRRILDVQLGQNYEQLKDSVEADMQFDFLLELDDHEASGRLECPTTGRALFRLNMKSKLGPNLPDDLRKLQEFVNPEYVTPLLMLSLVDYFDRWEEISEQSIPEADRAEVEYFVNRLLEHAIHLLFNAEIAATLTPPLRRVGRQMLEELFNRFCIQLYPEYHTFFNHAQYEAVINDYINALKGWTLKQRRGHSPVKGTKESLARDFGLTRVATFENRIAAEYEKLVGKQVWSGRGDNAEAEILLTLHPLETTILDSLRASIKEREVDGRLVPMLDSEQVANLGRDLGYRDEEILIALQLLAARGYTRYDKDKRIVYLAQVGPDAEELRAQLTNLATSIEEAGELLPTAQAHQLRDDVNRLSDALEKADKNEEELDELQTEISDIRQQLETRLADQQVSIRQHLRQVALDVERNLVTFRHSRLLAENITGQVAFVMHLNELRQRLVGEHAKIVQGLEGVLQVVAQAQAASGGPLTEIKLLHEASRAVSRDYEQLQERQKVLETQLEELKQWISMLRQTEDLFNAVARLPDLQSRLTNEVIPEIQAHLARRGLAGLSDWEPMHAKVEAVETELAKRRRHGNDTFANTKELYEQFLRAIDVGDYRPRSRYTYGEDEGSYRDLYEEVRVKTSTRLSEIAHELEREQTDLLKAEHITLVPQENRSEVRAIRDRLTRAKEDLDELSRALTLGLIQTAGEDLEAFGLRVMSTAGAVRDVRTQLGPIVFASHKLSEEEARVLKRLDAPGDVDVTDLFVSLHGDSQGGMELTQLLRTLESLYRKHRLSIRIRVRG
jgi:hypothetical protein